MKLRESGWLKRLNVLLRTQRPEPARQAERIALMQLHIAMPAKAGVIAVVVYFLFYSSWFYDVPTARSVVHDTLKGYFIVYIVCNVIAGVALAMWRRFPPGIIQWLAFTLGLLDGLFVAGLTAVTQGFNSIAYWVFPGLIVLNALSIPLAAPQIVLNLFLCLFYLGAGLLNTAVPDEMVLLFVPGRSSLRTEVDPSTDGQRLFTNIARAKPVPEDTTPNPRRNRAGWTEDPYEADAAEAWTEANFLKVSVLLLLTVCCYGVQVLAERQRKAFEEEREFAVREAQLHSAGRLAAEFTHQIKNPLAIINNAAFSMQRALAMGRTDVMRQVEIIQEEVEHSDRIVTQIMGYAQLTEGRVEKLNVAEELDRAIDQVFPAGAGYGVSVERDYVRTFPPLLMQRRHFSDAIVNLLQNAREALGGKGSVSVSAVCRPDSSIEVSIRDSGPGIAPEKQERIFEAYYSTKEKGTGLGLSIVKHNVELYSGTVEVQSELGKGARFVLTFPAKTVMGLD